MKLPHMLGVATALNLAVIPCVTYAANPYLCGNGTPATDAAVSSRKSEGANKFFFVESQGTIRSVFYQVIDDLAVVQGDLVIGDAVEVERQSQIGPVRLNAADKTEDGLGPQGLAAKLVLNGKKRWTGGVVPYVIDASLPGYAGTITRAMGEWSKWTPVKFVERTEANAGQFKNYVTFTVGKQKGACLADYLGMRGGQQFVRLIDGCEYGQILHEIGHVLGLDHEQNRTDRNDYVKVNIENIFNVDISQFEQRPDLEANVGPYDFDSIMHYADHDFTCNGLRTIEPLVRLPAGIQLGQRSHLSDGDIAAVKRIYR